MCVCVCMHTRACTLSFGEQIRALHMLTKYPTYSTLIYPSKYSFPLR